MGTADGYVVGLTKTRDAGSPSELFNLVIVAEGFTIAEQANFQTNVQELIDHLFSTAPFNQEAVACAINVYRLDVVSDEAGADTPNCADGTGNGNTVDTYFDASFCFDGAINRLVSGNSNLVETTVESVLPEWTQILVIVNHDLRGGAGGSIGWTTTGGSDWKDVALHEMGHAAFGLLDEYDCYTCLDGERGRNNYPGGEPMEPNVTIEGNPAAVKWSALVTTGPDSPTMPNSDCSRRNNGPSPVPSGMVGTFEGAHFHHCGVFRPQYTCKMRKTTSEFCAVCQQAIIDTMDTFGYS